MLRIGQIKMPLVHTTEELRQKAAKILRVSEDDFIEFHIVKQSIDARKKPDIQFVYTVDISLRKEDSILKRVKNNAVSKQTSKKYQFPEGKPSEDAMRPVIIGTGPAGLFCGYMLAMAGYRPILFERGAAATERQKKVEHFWKTGELDSETNVQFGEGGAGTFSDGKLNTLIKDKDGRNRKVLEIFVENGAPKDILYVAKPHIGTDILITVVQNMRNKICEMGGEVHFNSKFIDFSLRDGRLADITIETKEGIRKMPVDSLVLAIGHSARDTFSMLYDKKLPLEAKPFAVGVRVEHPQEVINHAQYGDADMRYLPTASYKVATTLENQRGVYSFCMCPGGYVVNASSEKGMLAVNGMSYHDRAGKNANSAMIVTVSPKDYGDGHPLSGVRFQRELEKKAYEIGSGRIPVQRFEDFCMNRPTTALGKVKPQMKGSYQMTNVRSIFPDDIADTICYGIRHFDRQIEGFADNDTILSGVESRTSSPVRIVRNETLQIENTGIYPCGEGAGYAGGITSAASDGIRVAEKIAEKCRDLFTKK